MATKTNSNASRIVEQVRSQNPARGMEINSAGEEGDCSTGGCEATGAVAGAAAATAGRAADSPAPGFDRNSDTADGATATFAFPSRRKPPNAASTAAPIPNGITVDHTRKPRNGTI